MRIANRNAREYVNGCQEFVGSHLYAERRNGMYIVFSYGEHWPLLLNKDGYWYMNSERYSVSTSRHASQVRPMAERVVPITLKQMKAKIASNLYGGVTIS